MKFMIRMVVVLLAVFISVSCDVNQPYEELEPEKTEKVSVSMTVKDEADSSRITHANIEFDGGRYTNQVMTTNGILNDSLEVQADPTFAYAYAEGYRPADTVEIDLTNDVDKVIFLAKKEDRPEGPGSIVVTDRSCSKTGEKNGSLTLQVENGAETLTLKQNGDFIAEKSDVKAATDVTFDGLASGDYTATAKKNNDKTSINEVIIPCDEAEGPGKIEIIANKCSDGDEPVRIVTVRIENGAEWVAITQNSDVIHDLEQELTPKEGQEVTFEDVPPGDFTVVAKRNGQKSTVDLTTKECESATNPPSCPLDSHDGTVVTFDDNRISANGGQAESRTQMVGANLSSGVYQVTLYGYDDHRDRPTDRTQQKQLQESYFISLQNDGDTIAETPELGDLPDDSNLGEKTTTVNDFTIDSSVNKLQGIHAAYPSHNPNSLNALCAAFKRTGDLQQSEQYEHEVTIAAGEDIWVSDHHDRPYDQLLDYGEVRPIRTSADPIGEVEVKVRFKLDSDQVDTEHFALEIHFEEDRSDAFRTSIYPDQSGVDGWTTATTEISASHFAGHAKDIAGVRIVHGDELDDSKPDGADDVFFATSSTDGKLWFYWRIPESGKSKIARDKKFNTFVSY